MRDLDRLRERGEDTAGRKLGLFALAGALSVAAIISAGVLSGGTREPEPERPDPLAQLALTGADPKAPEAARARTETDKATVELERLSFPATLIGDPNALEATVRAAEAEHAALSGQRRTRAADVPANTLAIEEADRLQRAAKHDPLMAQAMPERTAAVVPPGSEGAFTLQVSSFETRDAAERFANALRARGHHAFASQAEVPGRGRYFRVRVGPFTTRREALAYQKSFEDSERMHSILVTSAIK
jgi:DedD protein